MTNAPWFSLSLALLVLSPGRTSAAAVENEKNQPVFVGNYGEIITYRSDYGVHAAMHGAKEVVVFYPKTLTGSTTVPLKTDAFQPADFERYGLVELMVVPKSDTPFRSLEQLVKLRSIDLEDMNGLRFTRDTCGGRDGCSIPGVNWPSGTSRFTIEKPFHLWQIYTEGPSEFFILSSGVELDYDSWTESVLISLLRSLDGLSRDATQSQTHSDWRDLRPLWFKLWLAIGGACILLAMFPVDRWKRRRFLIGASALVASNALMIFGLGVTSLARYLGESRLSNFLFIGLLGAVSAVGAARYASRWMRAMNQGAVFVASIVGVLPLLYVSFLARNDPATQFSLGRIFSCGAMMLCGLVFGIVYGSVVEPSRGMLERASSA